MSTTGVDGTAALTPLGPSTDSSSMSRPMLGFLPQDSSTLSQPALIIRQLHDLVVAQPIQFKAVATEVSDSLQQAATQATGASAQALRHLASQFQQSSQTGQLPTLSSLGPQPESGAAAYSAQVGELPPEVASVLQRAVASALSGPAPEEPTDSETVSAPTDVAPDR